MARPIKLSERHIEQVCKPIAEQGASKEAAAQAAGISSTSLYKYQAIGMKEIQANADNPDYEPSIFAEFADAIKKAEAQRELLHTRVITRAALQGTWQASAWYLERTNPQRWAKPERVEITGADGGPVQFEAGLLVAQKLLGELGRGSDAIIEAEVEHDAD